jgi:hypothetical protein
MPRRQPLVAVLVGWTSFVWTTRIGNVWRDHGLTGGEKLASTALALSFTLLAAVVLVAYVQRRPWLAGAVLGLAGWTTGVWVVRFAAIATDGHGAGFVAVHLVLAVVSIGLSVAAVSRLRASSRDLSPAARAE